METRLIDNIGFLGHATVRISGSLTVYTDPYKIDGGDPADLVLITHSHYDHLSLEDLGKVAHGGTTVVSSKDCLDILADFEGDVIGLEPFEKTKVRGASIEAFPAYNIDKEFHPRENNWNGYVLTLDATRYYVPGDTDKIPEMEKIEADVAFFPVGGTYTMDFREAAQAAHLIRPQIAIPIHFGSIVGSEKDAQRFIELVGDAGRFLPVEKKP